MNELRTFEYELVLVCVWCIIFLQKYPVQFNDSINIVCVRHYNLMCNQGKMTFAFRFDFIMHILEVIWNFVF